MKFIIPLVTGFSSLAFSAVTMAGCTNLSTSIDITKPDSRYTDNGDFTVTDKSTGLRWRKCPLGIDGQDCTTGTQTKLNWFDAHQAAQSLVDDNGINDWRIPNKNELNSLVEYACSTPAINETFFPAGSVALNASGEYLTSTPVTNAADKIWTVNFLNGATGISSGTKIDLYFVRLVSGTVILDNMPLPRPIQPILTGNE